MTSLAALDMASVPMAALVSVIAMVLTGKHLTPVNVFMLISFIYVSRVTCSILLASGLQDTYDAYVSLNRIEYFLLLQDPPTSTAPALQFADPTRNMEGSAAMLKGSLWQHKEEMRENEEDSIDEHKNRDTMDTLIVSRLSYEQSKRKDEYILQDIEFKVASGSLTVITGPVGSGKSTLLSAIAGEVPDKQGNVICRGALVYAPQIAWVFSGTIRENVLFGEPYNESKYKRVIEACALREDIHQFPDCDETMVGERGELLSGGQQARVSLARAVYADVDLYLFDDPLSAVDVKVGQHIFEKCFNNLLGQKTRVIASHQEQLMEEADNIIVLYKGRVLGEGSFNELKERGILNETIDPLYTMKVSSGKSDHYLDECNNEDDGASDKPFPPQVKNEAKGLQISEEDRMIGVVSSKLYWNYFRSGLNSLAIISLLLLFLISQGKRQFYRFRERIVSSVKPRGVIYFQQYNDELSTTLLETKLSWRDDGKRDLRC